MTLGSNSRLGPAPVSDPKKSEPLRRFSEIAKLEPGQRLEHQLRILDGMLGAAVIDKDFAAALKIEERASVLLDDRIRGALTELVREVRRFTSGESDQDDPDDDRALKAALRRAEKALEGE